MNTKKTQSEAEIQPSCLGNVMPRFLSELKENWKPKTETKTGYGYHGSSKGDEIEYTLYFDSYRCEWTTKDRAFKDLFFKR